MTIPAWFFAIASLLGWLTVAHLLRRHARALRRLRCEHLTDLAIHGLASFRKGLHAERDRQAGPRRYCIRCGGLIPYDYSNARGICDDCEFEGVTEEQAPKVELEDQE